MAPIGSKELMGKMPPAMTMASPGAIAKALRGMDEIQAGPGEYRAARDEDIVRGAGFESMDDYQDQFSPEEAAALEPMYAKAMRPLASVLQRLRAKFDN